MDLCLTMVDILHPQYGHFATHAVLRPDLWIPSNREILALLGKYPSVVEKNEFTLGGFVKHDDRILVPVYVGGDYGFNFKGRFFMDQWLRPRLEEAGAFILDPFEACGEFLDFKSLQDDNQTIAQRRLVDKGFNDVINMVNNGILMPRAGYMLAELEGKVLDDGVSSEVAYFASNFGPVIGVRSDIRPGENSDSGINAQVKSYMTIEDYGGKYFENPNASEDAYVEAIAYLKENIQEMLRDYTS